MWKDFAEWCWVTKNSSCSAELLSVLLKIRSTKWFEREKMIYIALIVRALFKRFRTKSFFQIWFRTYFREPFSHRSPFFVFAVHYYTSIAWWLSTIKNIVCFYLLENMKTKLFFSVDLIYWTCLVVICFRIILKQITIPSKILSNW